MIEVAAYAKDCSSAGDVDLMEEYRQKTSKATKALATPIRRGRSATNVQADINIDIDGGQDRSNSVDGGQVAPVGPAVG